MNYDQNYVILDDRLDRMLDSTLNGYFTHAYCTAGECEVCFNGQTFLFQKGDCMIIVSNRGLTEIAPSDDFRVKVIYIEISYLQAATPHTSYGTVGGLSLYVNPVMRLNESEQWRCERDFDEIRYRVEHPHQYFHGDEMLAALQILFVDFF